MKALPKLWRRKIAGKYVGSFGVTIKGERMLLGTQDAIVAAKRRKLAMAGRRKFKDDIEGAAEETIAALDGTAPVSTGAVVDTGAPTEPPAHPSSTETAAPPSLPAPGPAVPAETPPPAQQQQAPTDWAAAANDAASAPVDDAAGAAAPADGAASVTMKFADLPFLKGALVTGSKVLVSLQVKLQALAAKWIGDVEVGRVGPAPIKVDTPEEFAKLAANGAPWGEDDPREQGRQLWEGFLKRVCPDDLPIPDWVLAPIVVAMFTLPVQLADMKKIDHSKDPPKEAPPDETRAAA